jgi:hypothetical protein
MGCEDASEMDRDETAPAADDSRSLRLAGFLTSVLGGALVCIGALLPWVRTGLEGLPDAASPTYYGIDLPDGVVVLALGVVMLICLGVTRVSSGGRPARVAAGLLIAASFLTIAIAGASLATAPARFEADAVDDVLADLAPEGTATDEQRAQVEQLMEVRLAPGPFVALGGGMLGVLGGIMVLSWVRREAAARAVPVAETDESEPTEM